MTSANHPPDLHVELSRHLFRDGQGAEADRWMAMLRERREECVATMRRDGLAVEVILRAREGEDDVPPLVRNRASTGERGGGP